MAEKVNIKLGVADVREGLRTLAAERPDYVSEGNCVYVEGDNAPGCLIGHLLYRAGIPLAEVSPYEGRSAHTLPFFKSRKAATMARLAQVDQDGGKSWSNAVNYAIEH